MCMFTENQRVLLHSEEYFDQFNTTEHTNEDDIQNFEEYKNVSQTLDREIEYLVDSHGEVLYRTVQYQKGLSEDEQGKTNLDYYKRVADYYRFTWHSVRFTGITHPKSIKLKGFSSVWNIYLEQVNKYRTWFCNKLLLIY
uniref:Uncharacterized protein n=1 Tax=Schistosoma japonicum TaxID=6182 RepID=C7TXV9_SCHJA|nr:hypothetical protein [Schistosoma japonicum]